MDSKRKANGTAAADSDDRSFKRQRLATEYDLSKGETHESTTVYGLKFLDQIRRTQDKNGRLVATYFEKLLPRASNARYYKQTRLPVSLQIVEQKLNSREFSNLAEVESLVKRMIANAKEFYPRSSPTFDDAERVRKALSNFMTKNNPAYQKGNYQAVATPLPPEGVEVHFDEDAEGEDLGNGDEGEEDAEGEDEDAEGEEEEEGDDDAADRRGSRRKSIVLKRAAPARAARRSSSLIQASPRVQATGAGARPDHQFQNVPYKGLSFQQAQEKLVEELIRYREKEFDDGYFEPFLNLPPRALKDYYKVIEDPMSLRKLQKAVKGIHGRNNATGVSDLQSWAAFEDRASLLWKNAFFYNEEGSEIYSLAQELQKLVAKQLQQAQAVVMEPPQNKKITLKSSQAVDSPTPASGKRITIHVGGGTRGSPADPALPRNADMMPINGASINGVNRVPGPHFDQVQRMSVPAGSPGLIPVPGPKAEQNGVPSPGRVPQVPGVAPMHHPGVFAPLPVPAGPPPHLATTIMEPRTHRDAGKGAKDALISRLEIQTHPLTSSDGPIFAASPSARETTSSVVFHAPGTAARANIRCTLPSFLMSEDRHFCVWTLADKNVLHPAPSPEPNPQLPLVLNFEATIHPGLNVIETHVCAGKRPSERVPGEPDHDIEILTAYVNVARK